MKPPEVIGHRGAPREAAENTLASFAIALDLGADGIELDVHVTADGVPVVHHDRRLRSRGARIAGLSLAELRASHEGVDVPTLDDVLKLVDGRCRLYVEVKAPGAEQAVVERVGPVRAWCAVHSFDHRIIARVGELAPGLPRGILMVSYLMDPIAAMESVGARDLWQQADTVDQPLIELVHRHGGRVIAWTVNDADRARELLGWGIDGLCTDTAREIGPVVRRSAGA